MHIAHWYCKIIIYKSCPPWMQVLDLYTLYVFSKSTL